MNRKLLVIIGAVALVFAIAIVGASSLSLNGSDSAPGEAKTNAACATGLSVKSPVDTTVSDAHVIKHVTLTGDLSQCVGQTLRVEVDLGTSSHAWAVQKFITAPASVDFTFDATTGDFRDTKPTVSGGDLVASGTRLAAPSVSDFGLITVTIAKTWG